VHRAQVLEVGIKAGSGNPGVQVLLLDSDADQILVPLEEFIRCWTYVPPAT
jgi:predicted ThiF/HesA family dinucleotide-utilizing enzyme